MQRVLLPTNLKRLVGMSWAIPLKRWIYPHWHKCTRVCTVHLCASVYLHHDTHSLYVWCVCVCEYWSMARVSPGTALMVRQRVILFPFYALPISIPYICCLFSKFSQLYKIKKRVLIHRFFLEGIGGKRVFHYSFEI